MLSGRPLPEAISSCLAARNLGGDDFYLISDSMSAVRWPANEAMLLNLTLLGRCVKNGPHNCTAPPTTTRLEGQRPSPRAGSPTRPQL